MESPLRGESGVEVCYICLQEKSKHADPQVAEKYLNNDNPQDENFDQDDESDSNQDDSKRNLF